MLCERCKSEEATVFVTQVINGETHKVDLCARCAKEMGVTDVSGFSLADLLLNLHAEEPSLGSSLGEEVKCPKCDYTQEQLQKTGRMGCAECYETFKDLLRGFFKDFHRAAHHCGKKPARQIGLIGEEQHLKDLQKELETSISEEKFEKAAWLRDQIKAIAKKG
ncbi:MAG: UvrB/UvrC motif-containing protein [bacterium]